MAPRAGLKTYSPRAYRIVCICLGVVLTLAVAAVVIVRTTTTKSDDVNVGDCVESWRQVTLKGPAYQKPRNFGLTDCQNEHAVEVMLVHRYPDGVEAGNELTDADLAICEEQFTHYVGVPSSESEFVVWPIKQTAIITDNDQSLTCLLGLPDGESLTTGAAQGFGEVAMDGTFGLDRYVGRLATYLIAACTGSTVGILAQVDSEDLADVFSGPVVGLVSLGPVALLLAVIKLKPRYVLAIAAVLAAAVFAMWWSVRSSESSTAGLVFLTGWLYGVPLAAAAVGIDALIGRRKAKAA